MVKEVFFRALLLIFISIVGFISGKKLKIDDKPISSLLIYVISPLVIFYLILESPAEAYYLKFSFATFVFTSFSALLGLLFSKLFWKDSRTNLFAFAAGTGNIGYFALPIIIAIFDTMQIALAVFIIIGIILYEFSVGYFIGAKGNLNYKESLLKVLKIPILYASLLAILFKSIDFKVSDLTLSYLSNFKGAYSVLGMMTIGIALSKYKLKIDWPFSLLCILWKHFFLPALGILLFYFIIPIDSKKLQTIALMLAVPMAANTVIISSHLGLHPEKAATTVMLSTLFSVFSLPFILHLILKYL